MWAARLGVPLRSLEVEVQADYDSRGELGVADIPPGYAQVRYIVTVECEASEEEIRRMLDTADAHSSYRDIFARPIDLRREVRIGAARA